MLNCHVEKMSQVMSWAFHYCAMPAWTKKELAMHCWLQDGTYCTWSAVADTSPRLYIYIHYCWQRLLFKTSLAFFSALDICDEAAGVRENLSHPFFSLPVKMGTRQEEKRVAGHSSFHHLSTTHAWLKDLCKLGGLHHLYQTKSRGKQQL